MELLNVLLNIATYSTFMVCMVSKLPQIVLLTRAKSTKGFSLRAVLLEVTGYIVFATYHLHHDYPFATYMEYPMLIVQDTVLLLLIFHYDGHLKQSLIYSLLCVGGWRLLMTQGWIIDVAMSGCTLFSASSKLAQLQCLWQSKDSSRNSALSSSMSTYTCLVLLRVCVLATLNSCVLTTIVYYRRGVKKQE